MTTTPTTNRCHLRPTGATVARPFGFAAGWFPVGHTTGTAKTHADKAHANTAIATYQHRRPGEDALH